MRKIDERVSGECIDHASNETNPSDAVSLLEEERNRGDLPFSRTSFPEKAFK
jgi:hypothetical protein